jgi:hypothetical protein
MSSEFQIMAGVALIVFAVIAPLSYCAVQRGMPTSPNDLVLECIKARGQWKSKGWSEPNYCEFPKAAQPN